MKVSLVVVKGKPEGMVIPIKVPRFVIGRDKECQLRPGSDLVSKQHCAFQATKQGITLCDLGSTNGTFLNEQRVEKEQLLKDGDQIRVGPLTFALRIVTDAAKPPMPTPVPGQKPLVGGSPKSAMDELMDDWLVAPTSGAPTLEPGAGSTIMEMRAVSLDDTVAEVPPLVQAPAASTGAKKSSDIKKLPPSPPGDSKSDSSSAASEMLRKMMDRRRSSS